MKRVLLQVVLSTLATGVTQAQSVAEAHWPQFRGPDGLGIAEGARPPVHFGQGSNVVWRTPLPAGASSPCVWDDRILLTTFSEGKLETVCLGRTDGRVRWRRTAPTDRLEAFHPAEGSPATATPTTDGQRVVVYFGSFGLISYDLDGQERWRLPLPIPAQVGDFGSGGSPVLVGGRVLLNRDQLEGSCLLAVDAGTGKEIWRANRPLCRSSFGSPVVWAQGARRDVVLPGSTFLCAYDLETGAERWTLRGLPANVCTTPVMGEGMLFFGGWSPGKTDAPMPTWAGLAAQEDRNRDGVIGFDEASPMWQAFFKSFDGDRDGRLTSDEWERFLAVLARGENVLLAVRPGGEGDITDTHVAWRQGRGLPYVASPLAYRGRVYLVKDGGMVSSFVGTTGAPVLQQERLGVMGGFYASPVAADGRIYLGSVSGTVVVMAAADQLDVLARNDLRERLVATPALVGDTLYVRTDRALYAFRE